VNILSVVAGVMKLVNWFARKFERDEYRREGRRDAALEGLNEREKRARAARKTRANTVDVTDRGLLADDPDARD
jgi:hypothetical protein|tara:strand:- start:2450 stop:2671 length:222 start_codon:yes stop_codon:yes gene_type:complete